MHEEITIVSAETEKPEPTEAPKKSLLLLCWQR